MKKLLLFDIDGTLTIQRGQIPESLQRTLRQLQAAGYLCSVATGNSFIQFKAKFKDQFQPNAVMILECGARITYPSGQDLERIELLPHIIRSLNLKKLADSLHFIAFCPLETDSHIFFSQDLEFISSKYGLITKNILSSIDKFLQLLDQKKCSRLVLKTFSNQQLKLPHKFIGTISPNEGVYEITNPNMHKGSGLRRLSQHLTIPLQDIVVVGNGFNDISMFREPNVDMKICVSQECPELVELSTDYVSDPLELGLFLTKNFL